MRGLIHHVAAVAGTLVLVIGMVTVAGTGAGAAVTVTGVEAPLPAGGVAGNVFWVSCSSAGNCAAVGGYSDGSGDFQGLLLTESAGSWTATEAPLPANAATSGPFAILRAVSCVSAGNCAAVGTYTDSSGNQQGLLLTQTAGSWTATEAPLPTGAASNPVVGVDSVSCSSAGNCAAVGQYTDSSGNGQGLLLTLAAGSWTATAAPLPAGAASNPGVAVESVSCAPAGSCAAAGIYTDSSGNRQGLLLTESSGSWAAAEAPLPAGAAGNQGIGLFLDSVSCASAGNCTAAGQYLDTSGNGQGLLLTLVAGSWTAAEAPLPANAATSGQIVNVNSVSCSSAGNCSAIGVYVDSSGNAQGLLLTQTAGSWTEAEASLPANAGPNPAVFMGSVSCASAGNCTAVTLYDDNTGNQQGVLLTQTAGTWATGTQAPLPAGAGPNPGTTLYSVSCASAGNCTVVGTYIDSSGNDQGLLLTQNTSALYGFGGFMAPVPKSTLTYKAGSAIPVKFVLTDASGHPIPAATAAALAANKEVEATLTGPGTSTTVLTQAYCSWNTTELFFQCNLKTPSALKSGKTNPYAITVLESPGGGGFVPAPPANANPETIYFK